MKKIGKENTPEIKNSVEQGVQEILESMSPAMADSLETDNAVDIVDDDKGPAFPDPPETTQVSDPGMSLHPKEFYDGQSGFRPAIEVKDNKGNDVEKKTDFVRVKTAQPATIDDLENLDESMIMSMPEIKATSFKIIDMLAPKPKDPGIRFRWANNRNYVAGNLGKYIALGFELARLDDVDEKRTPVDPSMVKGTQIEWYDVVLLKINVIRLMELYKKNIISAVGKLQKAKEKGLAEANRQFAADIAATPGASAAYNHYRNALGKAPVEFFATE